MNGMVGFLGASIAATLAFAPVGVRATASAAAFAAPVQGRLTRVTQTVRSDVLSTIARTHPTFITRGRPSVAVADSFYLNHLQLVLKPGAASRPAMETLSAKQHDPQSPMFRRWLTPQQFGDAFGVADSDLAAVVSWLKSEGLSVNTIYPSQLQIDFSGSVKNVNRAFRTREGLYTLAGATHRANSGDISVPAALSGVIAGVMGLSDLHATPLEGRPLTVHRDAAGKSFVMRAMSSQMSARRGPSGDAVPVPSVYTPIRALVPNDFVTMYGIRPIRNNLVVGTGVTIAVVESRDMAEGDWRNFVDVFNLAKYGGSFTQLNPAPTSGPTNCYDPDAVSGASFDAPETVRDAEWVTAIAPGAHLVVASCSDTDSEHNPSTSNAFGGVFLAASNLVNGSSRPDIISASAGLSQRYIDSDSFIFIDQLWLQADLEGISVFVATGDRGTDARNSNQNVDQFSDPRTLDANALATSAHVTAVGGTDLADTVDGTTAKYFLATPSVVGGSALSYVPEMAWNQSCGNGVLAKSFGYSGVVDFCKALLNGSVPGYPPYDPQFPYFNVGAGGGGSGPESKPSWQHLVFNAGNDSSRDIPDVSLFAGSAGPGIITATMICTAASPCTAGGIGQAAVIGGTGLSSSMFAGIQALMNQGLAARGLPLDQGNAAPTLYVIAATEYGGATGPAPPSLALCNANNGTSGTNNCIFHDVTRGSTSTECDDFPSDFSITHCYFYDIYDAGNGYTHRFGLSTVDANPTHYNVDNKAYGAQPGWSFATGLGSVNAKNLLIAWRAFLHAPPALH